MGVLEQWAMAWRVPAAALDDLRARLAAPGEAAALEGVPENSENRVQSEVRLLAPKRGLILWRNNVGALLDARGVPVRYGLCNDNKKLNETFKSADLVGIRRVLITPAHVGQVIGQFESVECKWRGWQWRGDKHEQAQANWAQLVNSWGGNARIIADPQSL